MNSTMQRPTIAAVKACAIKNIDIPHFCPVTKNKGAAGLLFEKLAEIPTSSACLDCLDGEVKLYPLKTLKRGDIVPKETVAITMMKPKTLTQSLGAKVGAEKNCQCSFRWLSA